MAEPKKDDTTTETPENPEYVKPNPQDNPRNISLKEIAGKVAEQHKTEFAETAPVVGEDNQPAEAPAATEAAETEPAGEPEPEAAPTSSQPTPEPKAEATPAPLKPGEEAIDPAKEYEMTVDGQKMKVLGSKIIDAGFRTFQKETAADFRLNVATELMQEAERRVAAAGTPKEETPAKDATPAGEPSNADLAKSLQFGTPEEAEKALSTLRVRGFDQTQITNMVVQQSRHAARDELAFQKALDFVKGEYGDLLSNDHLKRFFFMEENRYRAPKDKGGLGDTRPYLEVYKDIGENMRKSFKLPKATTSASPTATAAGRKEVKANAVPVPKTAASRLQETAAPKAKTASEIIAGMRSQRGGDRLTPVRKE